MHIPGHSSDGCKFLGYFGSKYIKSIPTKKRGHDPVPIKRFNIQQENNYIVNSSVDLIILHKNLKKCEKEARENVESDFDKSKQE